MPTSTGLAAQLSIGEETVYNTPVTASRGYEFESEAVVIQTKKVYGKSLRTLRLQRADRTRTYVQGATGPINMDVLTEGMGLIFKHMLGAVSSAQPDVANKPTEWDHTFTQSDAGLFGSNPSLTVQVGRPSTLGVVQPFTYGGVVIAAWSLSTKVGESLKAQLTLDAGSETTATALATPTYPTAAELLTFIDGTVTVDGTTAFITGCTIAGNNGVNTSRWGLANVKRIPVPNAEVPITGTLDFEFDDLTHHTKMIAGTTVALSLTFAWGEIDAGKANPYSVVITIPAAEIIGDPPVVSGPSTLLENIKFKALYDGSNPIITIVYKTKDTTP